MQGPKNQCYSCTTRLRLGDRVASRPLSGNGRRRFRKHPCPFLLLLGMLNSLTKTKYPANRRPQGTVIDGIFDRNVYNSYRSILAYESTLPTGVCPANNHLRLRGNEETCDDASAMIVSATFVFLVGIVFGFVLSLVVCIPLHAIIALFGLMAPSDPRLQAIWLYGGPFISFCYALLQTWHWVSLCQRARGRNLR